MANHVEERDFTLRLELRCRFPEDYQGDLDGGAWAAELPSLAAEVVRLATQELRRRGWSVRTGNRGRPTDEEVTLIADQTPTD